MLLHYEIFSFLVIEKRHYSHPSVSSQHCSNPLGCSLSDLGLFPHMHVLICIQLSTQERCPQLSRFVSVQLSILSQPFWLWTPHCISSRGDHRDLPVLSTVAWRLSLGNKLKQSCGSFCFLSSKINVPSATVSYICQFFPLF